MPYVWTGTRNIWTDLVWVGSNHVVDRPHYIYEKRATRGVLSRRDPILYDDLVKKFTSFDASRRDKSVVVSTPSVIVDLSEARQKRYKGHLEDYSGSLLTKSIRTLLHSRDFSTVMFIITDPGFGSCDIVDKREMIVEIYRTCFQRCGPVELLKYITTHYKKKTGKWRRPDDYQIALQSLHMTPEFYFYLRHSMMREKIRIKVAPSLLVSYVWMIHDNLINGEYSYGFYNKMYPFAYKGCIYNRMNITYGVNSDVFRHIWSFI